MAEGEVAPQDATDRLGWRSLMGAANQRVVLDAAIVEMTVVAPAVVVSLMGMGPV
jgi:hypothetical protein